MGLVLLALGHDPLRHTRVSTEGQTLDAQIEALKAAGCTGIFKERISGEKADRAQLARPLAKISRGDLLTITRLDRLEHFQAK